ncbi:MULTISPECIES: ABC transporter ATP-binding protein [Acidithiobacillus]|jgi:lipoprotein-releasing system ATP-binding protein|uniref:Lipoprotein releasing system ATP-binding protein LolD n=2 Tax=Acidithiobacillus caldus TaxID=33059 RepID=F9ZTE7_ACICS|nr:MULTISPECIES: ABC transporter ATP-binding protein [Acidithiobacillus]AEK56968.1 Lipoprotein releasing system ATP-binding protein LolD [Acidithiobacillus caldus SM-1]AIA54234.1 Lipoprotein releasing system ATP-binding protein LolD [Acidithiobacillus caldus ATCC 51756]AUW31762.1 ABC transporter ATP-binding protein [Acidithiobacillus caldus]MBU2730885.1 ABC transporter ATP-binding protein [Acidithiobacillus caldus]MBU2734607.1 ABC transporter ATP-binding protein [Acidithiobacillus caldus ATCC 
MSEAPVLAVEHLRHGYTLGRSRLEVLRDIELRVTAGERLAIVGASGQGKSTLMHVMGSLERPTAGRVRILGEDVYALSEAKRSALRNRYIGFVYQLHRLLPEFTALENVLMPLLVRRERRRRVEPWARELLERVGLAERLQHKPGMLSGGERQRVALARALVNRPALLLADEPTGNLDSASAERVHRLMLELNAELGTALVVVTHEPALAARMERVLHLRDGRLEGGAGDGDAPAARAPEAPEAGNQGVG